MQKTFYIFFVDVSVIVRKKKKKKKKDDRSQTGSWSEV
jgi:hypothetical protein